VLVGHIDGGARGNPGPAGYGVHLEEQIEGEQGRRLEAELFGYLGTTTNNIAEYAALLALLEYAVPLQPAAVEIFSDSELLVRQMEGRYRVKDTKLKVLHAAARRYDTYGGSRIVKPMRSPIAPWTAGKAPVRCRRRFGGCHRMLPRRASSDRFCPGGGASAI
jgi:ribonuclease HI